jgi:hypothetical protein
MDDGNSPIEGFTSLLRLSGHLVPSRAWFVGEATFSGIYTGTTLGLVCGQVGMMCTPFGPLVPFLCGSGIGFCLGLYATWKKAIKMTMTYAHYYPLILAHSLWTDSHIIVPPSVLHQSNKTEFNSEDTVVGPINSAMGAWIQSQGMTNFALCVLAAMTCQKDVNEVDQLVRQQLIEATASSRASSE